MSPVWLKRHGKINLKPPVPSPAHLWKARSSHAYFIFSQAMLGMSSQFKLLQCNLSTKWDIWQMFLSTSWQSRWFAWTNCGSYAWTHLRKKNRESERAIMLPHKKCFQPKKVYLILSPKTWMCATFHVSNVKWPFWKRLKVYLLNL